MRAGILSLVGSVVIFAGKLSAYALTGSAAVFSDAMESVVNVMAAGLLVYSLNVAARPADRDHPYGHGKVEFFTAGVEGTFIAVAGALILFEAALELITGPSVYRIDAGLLLVSAMAIVNALLAVYLIRTGRRHHSLALISDGEHLRTDVITSAGVIVGLVAVKLTGWVVLDPLVAIAVALHILFAAWKLVRRAVGGLMDEADEETLKRLSQALEENREPSWIDVHSMRAFRSGAVQHADLHMSVPRYFTADQLHELSDRVQRLFVRAARMPGDVIIHFDPCRSRQCPGCAMPDCPIREAPFRGRHPLTLEQTTRADESLEAGVPLAPPAV